MNRRLAGLAACLREFNLRLDTFENRLLTQKTVYLFQVLGVDLGYRFSWYLNGPYSQGLTHDAYTIFDEYGLETYSKVTFKQKADPAFKHVKDILESSPSGLDTVRWAELVTSMHFLLHFSPIGCDREGLFARLEEEKGFSREQSEIAWETLESKGLISKRNLTL